MQITIHTGWVTNFEEILAGVFEEPCRVFFIFIFSQQIRSLKQQHYFLISPQSGPTEKKNRT